MILKQSAIDAVTKHGFNYFEIVITLESIPNYHHLIDDSKINVASVLMRRDSLNFFRYQKILIDIAEDLRLNYVHAFHATFSDSGRDGLESCEAALVGWSNLFSNTNLVDFNMLDGKSLQPLINVRNLYYTVFKFRDWSDLDLHDLIDSFDYPDFETTDTETLNNVSALYASSLWRHVSLLRDLPPSKLQSIFSRTVVSNFTKWANEKEWAKLRITEADLQTPDVAIPQVRINITGRS